MTYCDNCGNNESVVLLGCGEELCEACEGSLKLENCVVCNTPDYEENFYFSSTNGDGPLCHDCWQEVEDRTEWIADES